jgi:hypothetical protein
MARVSDALETHERALKTCEPSCIASPAKLFLYLRLVVHREPRGVWQCRGSPQQGDEVWNRGSHDSVGALLWLGGDV